MTIEETIEYIYHAKLDGRKPDLSRISVLLEKLGNPEKSLKFVHVGGTNGKGSTCAYISSVLRKAGYRTGLFVSPYILKYNERFQCNGELISDDEIISLVQQMRPAIESLADNPPPEFEISVAMAMLYYKQKNCDIVVLEVGMGGETDATNIIDIPEVAVIATIGFDHVAAIGPELTDIARAKSGIVKGGDLVIYGGTAEVEKVFERACVERGAKLHRADFSRISNQESTLEGISFTLEPYGKLTIPLLGTYQPKNATLAITALEILREKGYKISDDDIASGIANVYWPGRFELLGRDPMFILDGAHNPEAVDVTATSLRSYFGDQKIVFIIGAMSNKDVSAMISYIAPMAKAFVAAQPDYWRAMESETLASMLSVYEAPVCIANGFDVAVKEAIERAGSEGIVCTIGSLHFSTDLRMAYLAYMGKAEQ